MMNLFQQLKNVVERLQREKVKFALAGGLATSTYRAEKRTTEDLDLLIYAPLQSEAIARKILTDLNLDIREARKANLQGGPRHAMRRGSSPLCILVGRKDGEIGVDFILPDMPWFESALERAQQNIIELGHVNLPAITVEDVILAKFFSLSNDSSRFKDADDIKSIFQVNHSFDFEYLTLQMKKLEQIVPPSVEKIVPHILLKTSKKVRKNIVNKFKNKFSSTQKF
ncbi:MAG: nucleotidyl transferase AbiEii/AbiGii toxin family protein [Deltaproteobacteria bacterium]|nr:nucleotidyl transferase AbiEii/AbiGii toxin family protein [Deltaproteobacteria bacterium]